MNFQLGFRDVVVKLVSAPFVENHDESQNWLVIKIVDGI